MKGIIEKFFRFSQNHTTLGTEIRAGLVTFATMAYIIVVNPAILSDPSGAGMDFRAVLTATCVASAVATLMMGLVANYPIALAPGMGLNAFFSYTMCHMMGIPWQGALAMVAISGMVFLVLAVSGAGERIFSAVPHCIRIGTAAGIGLFIAFIGLQKGGIVVSHPVTMVTLGDMTAPHTLLALVGLIFTVVLMVLNVKGAILIGIIGTGVVAALTGMVKVEHIVSTPTISATAFHLNFHHLFNTTGIFVIFTLLFVDVFDTLGTFMGIGEAGGFIKEGRFPRINQALFADAAGTLTGALVGTSTVTSYIESAAGISEGGRTGFAAVVTALLFLIAPFFAPLAEVFGTGITVDGVTYNPVTAPALIVVGLLMVQHINRVNWAQIDEAFVAFITMISMPLTYSISDGLALGFISYALVKAFTGRIREVGWTCGLIALFCLIRFATM